MVQGWIQDYTQTGNDKPKGHPIILAIFSENCMKWNKNVDLGGGGVRS